MNLGKILKSVVVVAAPILGTAIGGPIGGTLVVAALGGGGGVKKAGKVVEKATGVAVHKVGSPLAAMAVPMGLAHLLPQDKIAVVLAKFCSMFCQCGDGSDAMVSAAVAANLVGLIAGVFGLLSHMLGSGTQKMVDGRQPE